VKLNKSNFEIIIESTTTIELIDKTITQPQNQIHLNIVPLNQLNLHADGEFIDVIAIIVSISGVQNIHTKFGDTSKRNLMLTDGSGTNVNLTLWGEKTELMNSEHPNNIITLKSVKVSTYNGRSLSFTKESQFIKNYNSTEVEILKKKIENPNKVIESKSTSSNSEVKELSSNPYDLTWLSFYPEIENFINGQNIILQSYKKYSSGGFISKENTILAIRELSQKLKVELLYNIPKIDLQSELSDLLPWKSYHKLVMELLKANEVKSQHKYLLHGHIPTYNRNNFSIPLTSLSLIAFGCILGVVISSLYNAIK